MSSTPARGSGRPPGSSRDRTSYRCAECGWQTVKWVGRCGECQAWGTLEEAGAPSGRTSAGRPTGDPARPIGEVDVEAARCRSTGVGELDRVLGGGLVPGSVVLLAGEPGIGKSTLLLSTAAAIAESGSRVLYVSGEESAAQVRLRAERIGALHHWLYLAAETDLGGLLGHVEAVQPQVLVVDSVQTVASGEVEGAAGGVSQVREVAASVIAAAKARGMATILVGHVTKDGSIAGPRVLEHLVDVVLAFEGERHSRLRLLRAAKNRYGPADEVGCFDMAEDGLVELPDPSGLFLTRHASPVPGTCVTVSLEGRRPLLVEVQALVSAALGGAPRRSATGLDSSRLGMVVAVLDRRADARLMSSDIYAATVGGARVSDPAADLALALAVAGAKLDVPLPSDLVVFGEVGLAGEIRRVSGLSRRLAEAARLGFTRALVPPDPGPVPEGIRAVPVPDVATAIVAGRTPGVLRGGLDVRR